MIAYQNQQKYLIEKELTKKLEQQIEALKTQITKNRNPDWIYGGNIDGFEVLINGNLLKTKDEHRTGKRPCLCCMANIKHGTAAGQPLCRFAGLNTPGHIGIIPDGLKEKYREDGKSKN